ncbi:MAG: hypothetical protein HYW89_04345 [Candidatus Sungiibacteriota bacterium]|uniref:Radical SAM core domain-containing protein n=1 Tax=Candidatus Sungiibacteriota bacterium TaxID=2750080 RepID=A0A7T5UPT4_9BACT|nr:MAG: hypothetical protein HYW89_04345 [Candidatus Sungbacteria bacterium]
MRIQTFSIIAGSEACNACCSPCVSKMTLPEGIETKEPEVNWRNFKIACRLAKQCGCTTVMLTGKGEPTIFPKQITRFLQELEPFEFPLIELQTNGSLLARKPEVYASHLKMWYELGMTTIAISIAHYDPGKNGEFFFHSPKSYFDLPRLIQTLHDMLFSVRLTCVLTGGFIDNSKELTRLIEFAKTNRVEQLTGTPVEKPEERLARDKKVWEWTSEHQLTTEQFGDIQQFLFTQGRRLYTLTHGAVVFDVNGQNFCLNNCLSIQPDSEELRNIIFSPNGRIRPYWQYEGAVIL